MNFLRLNRTCDAILELVDVRSTNTNAAIVKAKAEEVDPVARVFRERTAVTTAWRK